MAVSLLQACQVQRNTQKLNTQSETNLISEKWKKSCFKYSMWHPSHEDRLEGRQLDMYMLIYIICLTADLPTYLSS